jgi:transcriptional regulator with XRE-family HTH domain
MTNSTVPGDKTVAGAIRAAREAQGVSLRDFADLLSVSHTAVRQWEQSIAEPETERLARWFNDPRDWVRELSVEIFVARYRATLLQRPYPTAA